MTIQSAFEHADGALFWFIQHCCIFMFFFFAFRLTAPLVFCEFCGRIGNETLRKRKHSGHEEVGSSGLKKNDGDAPPKAPGALNVHEVNGRVVLRTVICGRMDGRGTSCVLNCF